MKIQSNIQAIQEGLEYTFRYEDIATVVTTDSAGVVFEQYGACEYIGVNMPRNTRINERADFERLTRTKEITFSKYSIKESEVDGEVVILSRHKATTEMLKLMFPEAKVIEGNATIEDIKGKNLVGVIPPYLAAEAKTCTSYVIKNYNFAVDGDLDMASTLKRGKLMSTISVELIDEDIFVEKGLYVQSELKDDEKHLFELCYSKNKKDYIIKNTDYELIELYLKNGKQFYKKVGSDKEIRVTEQTFKKYRNLDSMLNGYALYASYTYGI
jgi:hypothetical protein